MKRILFGTILICAVSLANAQSTTFKPFRADFGLGYAIPSGAGSKGGVAVSFEPKYNVSDNLALGVRFEAAITVRGAIDKDGNTVSGSAKANGSYLLTGDYYINNNNFRPFVGLGAGIYNIASVTVSSDSTNTNETLVGGTKFGFAPRAGFELGHFRMAIEYNVAGKIAEINNNYLAIKIGFFIGGGRIKK